MSTQTPAPPDFVKAKVIADKLSLSEKTIYSLAKEGVLPHYRLGGAIRFKLTEIDQVLRANNHVGAVAA